MAKKKTYIYMRETTEGIKIISKRTQGYSMVMTLTPKQWNALKNSKKPITKLYGGDIGDISMEIKELDEEEKNGISI